MISSEVVSMSGATAVVTVLDEASSPVDLRSREVESDTSVDNVISSHSMLDATDDCILEGSVATNSLVVNDRGAVDASVIESDDVSSIVCTSIVDGRNCGCPCEVSDVSSLNSVAIGVDGSIELDEV